MATNSDNSKEQQVYDVLIIGAGAAGLSAALYTCRKKLNTVVVSVDTGGQTNLTSNIENYPGVSSQPGWELMKTFKEQAVREGCAFIDGRVSKVEKQRDGFCAHLSHGERIQSRIVIACFGKVPRNMGIPGEDRFTGRGVYRAAVYNAPLFQNKTVAVIGGGNSALESALALSAHAKQVHLVHRRETFKADEVIVEKLKQCKNLKMHLNCALQSIDGGNGVESIKISGSCELVLPVESVFIEIGFMNDPGMLGDLVDVNDHKEVVVNDRCATKTPGLFVAGDATTIPVKQTVTSAGEGAKAALEAHRYLTGGKGIGIDWTH